MEKNKLGERWTTIGCKDKGRSFRKFNLNCTTGQEIIVDYEQNVTTMGQMFYDRWRSNNKPTMVKLVCDNKILTNIQIGGRFYPTQITLVGGMSPVWLGLDFFLNYNWKKPENLQIQTKVGTICL